MLAVLKYLLVFVEVVSSLLLIGVILIQRTKGQGMGMAFGGGMGETLFGPQVGNVLTKTTVVLGIIFLVNTTLLAMLGTRAGESVTERLAAEPVSPAAPATPATPQESAEPMPMTDFDVGTPDAPVQTAVPAEPPPAAAPAAVPAEPETGGAAAP